MPFRTVLAILFLVVALPLLLTGTRDVEGKLINFRRIGLFPLALGGIFLLLACVRVVAPGEVGIPVTFGSAGTPMQSGVAITNPFASVKKLSVRTEEYTMSIAGGEGAKGGDDSVAVLGKDGATGHVDATIVYRLEKTAASKMYREVGTNFVDKLVRPTTRSCIRDAFVGYTMVQAATSQRSLVAADIEECINDTLEPRGLVLEDLQLRDVGLSESVQNAINAKVEAEQGSLQQQFELAKATQEAEIKRVEAQGVADSEQIIKCGATLVKKDDGTFNVVPKEGAACEDNLTQAYLQYQYIQALKELVDAPNNSTIVIPSDQSLTPLLPLPSGGEK